MIVVREQDRGKSIEQLRFQARVLQSLQETNIRAPGSRLAQAIGAQSPARQFGHAFRHVALPGKRVLVEQSQVVATSGQARQQLAQVRLNSANHQEVWGCN